MIKTFVREDSEFLDKTADATLVTPIKRTVEYLEKNSYLVEHSLKQGDIITIDFGIGVGREKSGLRPAVVLSEESKNDANENIIVAPLTSYVNKAKYAKDGVVWIRDSHIVLSKKYYTQLRSTSIIQLEDVRAVSKHRINNFMGTVSERDMGLIKASLSRMFGL